MSATTPIPDNALLLWLQDESNNECTTAESITQMYRTMHTEEFDPVSHFKQDDHHHCFLIFEKVNDDSIPTDPNPNPLQPSSITLQFSPTRIGNPTPHDGLAPHCQPTHSLVVTRSLSTSLVICFSRQCSPNLCA